MNRLPLYLITALLAVVILRGFDDAHKQLAASQVEYVQTICDQAHNEINGASERACGDAQDKTNTEYLCNSINTSCWVEAK